jgi:hypothetical protein
MVEQMMIFGLGFLSAILMALLVIPAIHRRAVRLTERRLRSITSLAAAEIQSKKDQLRAEFALSTRRVEQRVEEMEIRIASLLAELGRKGDMINRLKLRLGDGLADAELVPLVPDEMNEVPAPVAMPRIERPSLRQRIIKLTMLSPLLSS